MTSLILVGSCQGDFLEKNPQGVLSESVLANRDGINALLIAAYAELDGWAGWEAGDVWAQATTNWVFGDVVSDDAYKGSDAGDQKEILEIEGYQATAGNRYFTAKWRSVYDGVSRSNDVIRILGAYDITDMSAAEKEQVVAEARFLRGFYHLEAKKMWNKVPYLDETVEDVRVSNTADIWPQIEADFNFAQENLPATQAQKGRATSWAAKGFLAKSYMFQKKYAQALTLLNEIINSGEYDLADSFHDNFRTAGQTNNPEVIFAVQASVNEGGTEGENGGYGNVLNYPYNNGPGKCCGFHQPSLNLVNAFKTDANGLPLLDTFNDADVTNDEGINSNDPFTPYAGTLDPRLDWTVGRRGIPYLDWGLHGGRDWIRDQTHGGPFSPIKHVYYKSEEKTNSTASGWAQGPNANDYMLIRYADVLLWAAECEVETGSLEKARGYVNQIRARAANPATWVKLPDGTPAANYVIGLYNAPWTDQGVARKAVRFERRLELAMEGHRFFDLVRYGNAAEVLNACLVKEKVKRTYLSGAVFTAGRNEYYPIPTVEIQNSYKDGAPTLTQNPGY